MEALSKEVLIEEDFIRGVASRLPLYRDRIVVSRNAFDFFNSSIFEWMNLACTEAYAIVLPWGAWDYGIGALEWIAPLNFKGSQCRAYTISVPSLVKIREILPGNYTVGIAEISGDDGDPPVRVWLTSGWFFFVNIVLAVTSCAVAVLGATRLWDYFAVSRSCVPQITTICIWLEIFSALIRFIYWGIDPHGARGLIPSPQSQSAFRTASLPLTISATILLSVRILCITPRAAVQKRPKIAYQTFWLFQFYWHESLSATSLKVHLNLSRLRIPAYIICFLCFLFEIIAWIFYLGDIPNGFFRIINQIWYIIVVACLSVFYIVTATRIFIALRRSSTSTGSSSGARGASGSHGGSTNGESSTIKKNTKKMRVITMKLSVCAACLVLFVIIAPLTLAPFYTLSPLAHPGYLVFWWVAHTIFNIKSVATILAFTPRSV